MKKRKGDGPGLFKAASNLHLNIQRKEKKDYYFFAQGSHCLGKYAKKMTMGLEEEKKSDFRCD